MQRNFGYDQRDDAGRWDQVHANGVCLALSAWWIIKRAKGEDFQTWLRSDGARADAKAIYDVEKRTKADADHRDLVAYTKARGGRLPPMGTHRVDFYSGYTTHLLTNLSAIIQQKAGSLAAGTRNSYHKQTPSTLSTLILLGTGFKLINWRAANLAAAGNADASHAIAVEVHADRVLLFEPNMGEWETNDGYTDFEQFFKGLCAAYDLTTIDMVSIIEFG